MYDSSLTTTRTHTGTPGSELEARARDGLLQAAVGLGLRVEPGSMGSWSSDIVLVLDDRRVTLECKALSQVTGARAEQLVRDPGPGSSKIVVADRITADARTLLTAAGLSWLDLRGHLHLRGDGVLVDSAVDAVAKPVTLRAQSPLRGKAGLAVGYWLCAHPAKALSPTGHSPDLGFAPSTISTAAATLAEAGLVDEDRRAVLPELFWELATAWRPQWTWLGGRPDPDDEGGAWALTGDRVAAKNGAPLVSAGTGPLELFVPDAVTITIATRRYGVSPPGAGAAAVAIAPVRQVLTGEGRLDGWRTAPDLAVALGLAMDPARGREILQDWPGEGHVWL